MYKRQGLWREPIMPSLTTQLSSDSMPASKAMVKASGSIVRIRSKSNAGRLGTGSALEMEYKLPMVLTGSLNNCTMAMDTSLSLIHI